MNVSDIKEFPAYFDYYIKLNGTQELDAAFDQSLQQIDALDMAQLQRIGIKSYAADKWSVHKIIQHLSDWERIWSYRTLLAVRQEGTLPPGLEHNIMADHSNADEIPIERLVDELRQIRKSTIAMFLTFNPDMLLSMCKFSNNQMSLLAMGFNIIGHQLHHFNIIEERYLPLDSEFS